MTTTNTRIHISITVHQYRYTDKYTEILAIIITYLRYFPKTEASRKPWPAFGMRFPLTHVGDMGDSSED
ncbi:MAG: hypothetical protein HDS69_04015 [Bacteroidales bacterium]|nr:hypothetical protein [Bacteroidales bacterium]